MTLMHCEAKKTQLSTRPMNGKPWQLRAKKAGLSQKLLAALTGQTENTVSRQLSEKFETGVPVHVRAVIWAWERYSQKEREAMMEAAEKRYED